MAVGDGTLPVLHPVDGVRIGVASAGIKRPGRKDVVIFEIAEGAEVAAVFTRNAFCAAPVEVAREHLKGGAPRYLLVNTGNANAGTGQSGLSNARDSCAELARLTDVEAAAVLPFSTGVIGEPLPLEKIVQAMPAALRALSAEGWADAASGIMTTDTRPKGASRQFEIEGETVTVTGIAKGAGMIKPNMATMLGYIATDAPVARSLLQSMLRDLADRTFNRVTVDGDTSTNDSCVLISTGRAKVATLNDSADPLYQPLFEALETVFMALAQALVRDGEGASKFVTVAVSGGESEAECLQVAYTVAESPLVKTALFASDPNWGRILAAIGRAGVAHLAVEAVTVRLNGVLIAEQGGRAETYTEEQGAKAMAADEIEIDISLGRGEAAAAVWTCDLSEDYVRINAEYRT